MEKVKEKILNFLQVNEYSSGFGYNFDYELGRGSGGGSGSGFNDGRGYGSGCGYDAGYSYDDDTGHGYGYGSGSGSTSGDEGFGEGDGDGYGAYDGFGYGYGYGFEDNNNIEYLNFQKIYTIDGICTLIDSVHGNFAQGRILNSDLTTLPCFIAKYGNFFAHGKTLKQALFDAQEKYNANRPLEERILEFNKKYPDRDKKVPASELFSWHHILTGSCLMGRKYFCEQHNLDYVNGKYTVNEFIAITKYAYGGDIIEKLEVTFPS